MERVSPLSRGERTSPAPVPSAALPKPETRSWKPELGFTMRLGAQVQPLHHLCRLPHKNFSSHLANG
ncbi:unnamed protein product [Staurois parvus]|uniref:Uncharacterized protein n=1 Tax=Staurois parvus TaxID=386267 RepID=A0ABN9GJ90_9NEOB|nr:unnamed protein product [Staurois parvus]